MGAGADAGTGADAGAGASAGAGSAAGAEGSSGRSASPLRPWSPSPTRVPARALALAAAPAAPVSASPQRGVLQLLEVRTQHLARERLVELGAVGFPRASRIAAAFSHASGFAKASALSTMARDGRRHLPGDGASERAGVVPAWMSSFVADSASWTRCPLRSVKSVAPDRPHVGLPVDLLADAARLLGRHERRRPQHAFRPAVDGVRSSRRGAARCRSRAP